MAPTTTLPPGISSIISFIPENSGADNLEAMKEAIASVKTGQVTYAVRDTRLEEKDIHEGDYMGIGDHGILAVGNDMGQVAVDMVKAMADDTSEVISVYYGKEVSSDAAEALSAKLAEEYPDCEIQVNSGGQPVYYYIISVE